MSGDQQRPDGGTSTTMRHALDEIAEDLADFELVRTSAAPIRYDTTTGTYSLYRFDDVSTVLKDSDVFSNTPPGATYESQQAMLFTDPPRHRQLRGLVSKAFTPGAIARLESRLGELMDGLLADTAGAESFDVVARVADPLPELMIAEMLGADSGSREEFKRWSRSFSLVVTSQAQIAGDLEEHLKVVDEMFTYFEGLIARRRTTPGDDLISVLVGAEADGQRLTREELQATCAQLLAAGSETTTNLIGNAVMCLAERPALVTQLRADPSLVPSVIEEVLRFLSPVQFVPRFCKRPITLYDQTIEPGSTVLAMLASANRDRDWFDYPNHFRPRRHPNRHLGFGFGIHFCLGAALARLEAKVAIERMLKRLSGEWTVAAPLERLAGEPFFFGVQRLPLTVIGRRDAA
jgi:cytochrome P450